jgi:hypothetical protein
MAEAHPAIMLHLQELALENFEYVLVKQHSQIGSSIY